MADFNQGFDWNDTIESDGQGFVLLEDGDYNFVVENMERGRFPGSAKMCACNKATLTLRVESSEGTASIRTDLILNSKMEWLLSSFFRCIGQKKRGEKLVMDWNKVVGAKGRARVSTRSYIGNDGKEHQVNQIDRYYDFNPQFFAPANSEPVWQPAQTDNSAAYRGSVIDPKKLNTESDWPEVPAQKQSRAKKSSPILDDSEDIPF